MDVNGLPDRIIHWIKKHIDPNAAVTDIIRLKGSTSSSLHRVTIKLKGSVRNVVLRQFDNREWLQEEPGLAVHEAASLRKASESNVPVPRIIAFDETGKECGIPVVLMSYLNGEVELLPDDKQKWLYHLAKTLTAIHHLEPANFPYQHFTYQEIQHFVVPAWSNAPNAWEKTIEYIQGPCPDFGQHFIHRDYHPANILWDKGVVSGVVDWVNACIGPAGVDIGHCRVNLAQLYDVDTADAFLEHYDTLSSHFTYDVYWDIISLIDISFGPPTVYPGWKAFGVSGLTNEMMMERLDRYAESLAERI